MRPLPKGRKKGEMNPMRTSTKMFTQKTDSG
mgnify:CR=1 FL=1